MRGVSGRLRRRARAVEKTWASVFRWAGAKTEEGGLRKAYALRDLVRDEPHASIAVLTPDPSVSRTMYSGLCRSEIKNLRHITNSDFLFEPGIDVTEVEQVKGLEFDYVIVVEANAGYYPDTDLARRILHVACTRALHQLWITSVGTPSPIIREALEAHVQ